MILYNVTVIIDLTIEDQWVKWTREQYIPCMIATNLFISARLLKILDSPNEGVSYCIQYIAESFEKYSKYREKFAEKLNSMHNEKFAGHFVSFDTAMEFIDTQ